MPIKARLWTVHSAFMSMGICLEAGQGANGTNTPVVSGRPGRWGFAQPGGPEGDWSPNTRGGNRSSVRGPLSLFWGAVQLSLTPTTMVDFAPISIT
jgi:hypothetical protein